MKILGEKIRERREELGMTQQELAVRLGYRSRSTVNKIEHGINDLNQTKIEHFASVLGTSTAYLMGIENDEVDLREQMSDIQFALHTETETLTDEDMRDVLDFVQFLKQKRQKNSDDE